jgi:cytidylate kinase
MKKLAVAIDGPAGAGKSTVARLAAKRLGYVYIDTGAMYRAVAWRAMQQNGGAVDEEKVLNALLDIDIELEYVSEKTIVRVNGEDVSEAIRTPEVSKNVSFAAQIGKVREKLVELQRKMAASGGVVMDGRDICTHVLPNAEVKIFMTASIAERAARRFRELSEKGYAVELKTLEAEIAARDKADMEREISPLIQSPDAVLLDTTNLSIDESVAAVLKICGRDEK